MNICSYINVAGAKSNRQKRRPKSTDSRRKVDENTICTKPCIAPLCSADWTSCVSDLQAHTGLSQSLVSHHLTDLIDADLVEYRQERTFMEYSLTDKESSRRSHTPLCRSPKERKARQKTW